MNCVLEIKFYVNPKGSNIKSTGFTISGESSTVYLQIHPILFRETDVKWSYWLCILSRPTSISANGVLIKIDSGCTKIC
jgi:hypothetical protein